MNSLSDAAEEDSVEICLNIQMPRTAAKVATEIDGQNNLPQKSSHVK